MAPDKYLASRLQRQVWLSALIAGYTAFIQALQTEINTAQRWTVNGTTAERRAAHAALIAWAKQKQAQAATQLGRFWNIYNGLQRGIHEREAARSRSVTNNRDVGGL